MVRLACLVTVVAVAVAIPSAATAQAPAGDSVTGSLLLSPPDSSPDHITRYFFDVRSGPAGENPSGTVTLRGRFITDPGAVTCLAVRGNRASIGVSFTGGGFVEPSGSVIFVDDLGGEGQDTIARSVFVGPAPDRPYVRLNFLRALPGRSAQPIPTHSSKRERHHRRRAVPAHHQGPVQDRRLAQLRHRVQERGAVRGVRAARSQARPIAGDCAEARILGGRCRRRTSTDCVRASHL